MIHNRRSRFAFGVAVIVYAGLTWSASTAAQNAASSAAARPYEESKVLAFEGLSFGMDRGQQVKVVQLASGLVSPWSIVFVPNTNDILVAERPGRIRIIRNGVLDAKPFYTLPRQPQDVSDGRNNSDRLHFLAVHPQFSRNGLIYFSYIKWGDQGHTLAVARGRFDKTTLVDVKDVFVTDVWLREYWPAQAASCGRLLFGPDGMLYVTVGDRDYHDSQDDNSARMKAQSLDNHNGKVLRIRDDGTVPNDNPFANTAGAKPEIYTYGHRNPMGLAFVNGHLWETEVGPMAGDELNLLLPGRNYGWPLVSTGRIYSGSPVSDQPWFRPGMDNPEMFWSPSVSPSSLVVYTGDRFPKWKGTLLFGALNGHALWHVFLNDQGLMTKGQPYHNNEFLRLDARVRDVIQGPDGNIYVSTERGGYMDSSASGAVLRIEPVQ